MRKLAIGVVAFLVLVVAALAILPRFINVNQYHDKIQSELSEQLARPVQLGQMNLSLLPPSFKVQNAVIGDDSTFGSQRPFAQAQSVSIRVKLLPLLRKDVKVESIVMDRPVVEMIRNEQGVWNFATLGNAANQKAGQPTQAPPQPGQKPQPGTPAPGQPQPAQQQGTEFSLGKLEIIDGTLAITDRQKHQSRAVYDHIDLTLEDYAKGKPFEVALAAHLPGSGKQIARLEGKGGPINDANMLDTPFNGNLELEEVALSGAQKFLNSEALAGIDATLSGVASVKNDKGKLQSSGSLKADNAVIKGTQVGYPIALDYDITDDLTNDVIQINRGTLKLGQTPMSLSGSLNTKSTPSLADLNIQASDVSIAEVGRLAAALGVALNPGMDIAGRLNANIKAQGATNSPALNGTLSARNLTISGKDVPAPVKVPSIDLQLNPQQIRSNDFVASAGSTNVNVRFALSQYTTPQPSVDAVVKTAGANIAELINIARAAGITAVDGMNGSGSLWLDVHAVGPVKNTDAMQFSGNGSIQNASVKTATMTQPMHVRAATMRFTQNTVALDGVQASVGSTNASGNLSMRNFQAPNVQFNLTADKLDALELQRIFGVDQQQGAKRAALNLVPRANAQAKGTAAEPSIIQKMTGTGTVNVGQIVYDQLVLNQAKANVQLNKGLINLNPVNANLYGGSSTGTVALDMRGQNTIYNVNLKTQKVDSNKLISSVSSVKDVLFGLLFSNIQAQFASVPNNPNIASTLNGRLSLNLNDGRLAKVDILNQLSSIGKFQSLGRTAQDFTKLQSLSGDFDVRNGVATTNNLKALIDGGTLAATGAVNLVSQDVDMKVTAVLSKSYSQQVGGNSIGGFMNTALANSNGELVLPVLVSGNFQNMRFAPDVQTIAQMKVQNLLPSFGNPGQLTSGILGAIGGKKGGGQGGVGGILDALSGKPKQNQQYDQQQQGAAANNAGQAQQQQQPTGEDMVKGIVGLFGNKKKQQQQQQQQQQQPR